MRSTNQRHALARLCAFATQAGLVGLRSGRLVGALPSTTRRPVMTSRQA
jgi:hypothetical protein